MLSERATAIANATVNVLTHKKQMVSLFKTLLFQGLLKGNFGAS